MTIGVAMTAAHGWRYLMPRSRESNAESSKIRYQPWTAIVAASVNWRQGIGKVGPGVARTTTASLVLVHSRVEHVNGPAASRQASNCNPDGADAAEEPLPLSATAMVIGATASTIAMQRWAVSLIDITSVSMRRSDIGGPLGFSSH